MRIAYLTCELKSRDLDSRLLIAAHLLRQGISVVVGQQWSMIGNARSCARGVYLFKTANKIQADGAAKVKASGHRIAFMDEEVLAITDPSVIKLSTAPEALALADIFLYQDEAHRQILGGSGPIVGSPRVDLLRSLSVLYQSERKQCRKGGPYILFNTNFSFANSVWGSREVAMKMAVAGGAFDMSTADGREFVQSWLDTEQLNLTAMVELIQLLSPKLKFHRIVVRPHPGENHNAWRKIAGLEVVSGTTPAPWILGADLTVHSNSTTGLEAALLNRPCLNLNPASESRFSRSYVTNRSDFQARSGKEGFEAVSNYLNKKQGPTGAKWLPDFPANSAGLVAKELAGIAPEVAAFQGWTSTPRLPQQVEKFSASMDETKQRMASICVALGHSEPKIEQLDDSLFLFVAA